MPMQVILLERIDNLGALGDLVNVKPGYARNYLIPQNKALRASPENIAYFEAQKKEIEKRYADKRKEAEKDLKKLENLTVDIIRHASESGQLYGSVAARDIAQETSAASGLKIERPMVTAHNAFKTIGLFPVTIALHPEVRTDITVNIARTGEEAKIQRKSGKALIADEMESSEVVKAEADAALEEVSEKSKEKLMEKEALEAEKEMEQEKAEKKAEEHAKAEKKAAKKAAQAAEAEAEAAETAAAEAEAANDDSEAGEEKAGEDKSKE